MICTRCSTALLLAVSLASAHASSEDPVHPFAYISFVTEDQEVHFTPFTGTILDPDHSLVVVWDEDALRAALAGDGVKAGRSLPAEQRLATLHDLVQAFLVAQSALVQAKALGPSTRSPEALAANNRFSVEARRALDSAKSHQQALSSAGLTEEAADFRKTMNTWVLEDYEPLARAMMGEIEELNTRVAAALEAAPRQQVQMRATLVGAAGSGRLHLDGYDTYETFDPRETPRFQFELDERARQEVEASEKLGQVVREALSGELKQKLEAALGTLRKELDALAVSLQKDVLAKHVTDAVAEMRNSADARFGPVVAEGQRLLSTLEALKLTTPPFGAETDAQLLLRIYEAVTSQIGGLVTQLEGLERQFESFVDHVEGLASSVPGAIADSTRALLEQSLANVKGNPSIAAVLKTYEDVRASLGLAVEVARTALKGAELPRSLDQPLDTRLDLLTSTSGRRYSGDTLILEAAITQGEGPGSRVVARGFRKMRLMHLGIRGELRGALIFSDPAKEELADQDWEPTPALGYMLHYGRKSGRFWNEVFDPGVGIAMTILDYEDEDDFEFGLAANVSVFRSLLWFGYGRNIQAETDFFHVGVNPLAIGRLFREGGSGTGSSGARP